MLGKIEIKIKEEVEERWGEKEKDNYFEREIDEFEMKMMRFGEKLVGIKKERGYNIEKKEN